MADHSDSDSSPKSSSSSSSSSSGARRRSPQQPSHPAASDESGSSDGVLVELPGHPDQDSRSSGADPDSGILVNIDGSTQEAAAAGGGGGGGGEDATGGETFEDAPEDLSTSASGGGGARLEESMAVIEIGESARARLEDATAECRKYKEEREVFGREVAGLRRLLQGLAGSDKSLPHGDDESVLSSPTPLHSMLEDCSRLVLDLNSVIHAKEHEIESLHAKNLESCVSRDVIDSYLGSWRESLDLAARKMLASLDTVVGQDRASMEDAAVNGFSLVEEKTLLLVEKHRQFLLDIEQLGQFLQEVKPGSLATGAYDHCAVLLVAQQELFESMRNEADFQQRLNRFEDENRRLTEQVEKMREALDVANAEASKTKAELEQTEHRLSTAKEKLSMAVTKGKSLVQHRDSLKHSLAEKTDELERCTVELQWKSAALEAAEARAEELRMALDERSNEFEKWLDELRQTSDALEAAKASILELSEANSVLTSLQESISQKDGVLQHIEEAMSESSFPQELLSLEMVDRVGWLVEQKKMADMILMEHRKVKDIIGSIDLPHTILTSEVDSQISWLVSSLSQTKNDIAKMQDEASHIQLNLASHESQLVSMHEEIDRLTMVLLEEKQEKDIFVNEHAELMSQYNATVGKLSAISSEKNELIKALAELSEITLDNDELVESKLVVEKCLYNIQQRIKSTPFESESFEMLQSLLYVRNQELMLCRIILEEDMIDRSERLRLSAELQRVTEEVSVLKNDKESLQKELGRVEAKSSLLREKLSTAVKKGKGLVQEREGLKQALDEKNSEIQKLKHGIDASASAIVELKGQIELLSSQVTHVEKLESDIVALNDRKDKFESMLDETKSSFQIVVDSIKSISLPTDNVFEGPTEKISWIAQYIRESEAAKSHVEKELHKLNEQAALHASRLSDAFSTIKTLEDELSKSNEHISFTAEEKREMLLHSAAIEEELKKTNEELSQSASKLADANMTIKTLEDELSKLKEHISFIAEEKQQMLLHNAAIEEELEKTNEELSVSVNKLADANMTIASLEDALSQARKSVSILDAEKNEAEAKHGKEISELNVKLAEFVEELDKAHGNLHRDSAEQHVQLEKINMLIMDDSLLSLMAEEFGRKISSLKNISLTMKNMHEQLAAKGLQFDPSLEDAEFAKLFSLPDYDSFITDRMAHSKTGRKNIDDALSFTSIVEQLSDQAKFLGGFFKDLSSHMDDDIALASQALQATMKKFTHILEHHESLKLEVNNMEAHSKVQETKLLSLQKELKTMSSTCIDATHEIQIAFHDLLDIDSAIELGFMNPSTKSESKEIVVELKDENAGDHAKVADNLISIARRLRMQSAKLASGKDVLAASLDDLKHKLKQAELTAETASQDHQLYVERVSVLEKDLRTLQDVCNEMEIKIEKYQAREDTLKAREEELLSLEHTTRDTGTTDLVSKDQLKVLVEKVNKLNIPLSESRLLREMATLSSPVDKLFYVIDEVDALQQKVEALTYENEDMQLTLESNVRETEQLKEASKITDSLHKELELKGSELLEITVSLERMIQWLGGKDTIEEQKPLSAQTLLSLLERQIIASSVEAENTKSVVQDLGVKLQGREKVVDELTAKVKMLEDSYQARVVQPEISKDRAIFEASSTAIGSEITEVEDLGPIGKASLSSVPTAAHARTMRKGSNDHLILNIGSETERLVAEVDADDKGHIFKSLHTSGMIPVQGKHIADKVDSVWVSGSRMLMNRPRARLGLMVYWLFLHLWLLGTIL